jgi:hypothetical protein
VDKRPAGRAKSLDKLITRPPRKRVAERFGCPERMGVVGSSVVSEPPRETAYYYPEPYWLVRESGWIKSLLLFFDEVAILLPEYMRGRHLAADPTLAEPLEDRGLLRVLEPEWFVDETATTKLTDMVRWLMEQRAFENLPETRMAELSMSRMGYSAIHETAHQVFEGLQSQGLAVRSEDGVSIPMHPFVRAVYLVLLAQLARDAGARCSSENGRPVSATSAPRAQGFAPSSRPELVLCGYWCWSASS